VEQSKEEAQVWSQRSLKVLETLAEAVGHDPFNIPPSMVGNIRGFERYVSEILVEPIIGIYLTLHFIRLLLEIRTAIERPIEQSRTSRLFLSNRLGNGFTSNFDKRLGKLQQKFEACSHRSGFDTPFVSTGALQVPPYHSLTLESKPFRRRFLRFGPVSSTCADLAWTSLKVLEKLAGSVSVPFLSGAVSGVSGLLDTAKVER
jgi:hypothetical protein